MFQEFLELVEVSLAQEPLALGPLLHWSWFEQHHYHLKVNFFININFNNYGPPLTRFLG